MRHLKFFLLHAIRGFQIHRQRTLFVIFCIAVGVASIVALRTVALMIQEELVSNLQSNLRGDIRIDASVIEGGGDSVSEIFTSPRFTEEQLDTIETWSRNAGYETTAAHTEGAILQMRHIDQAEESDQVRPFTLLMIEPDVYPFYKKLELVEPIGASLADVIVNSHDIVIPVGLSESIGVGVNDQVRISGAVETFRIAGIVENTVEASVANLSSVIIPFTYIDYETAAPMFNQVADAIYVRLPEGSDVEVAQAELQARFPELGMETTEDLRLENQQISNQLVNLSTVMGLLALLIGAIGIMNTMQVIVRWRMREIGVLKALGLRSYEIALWFICEVLLLGLAGSVLGCLIGMGLSRLLLDVGQRISAQELSFGIYPNALVIGLFTGVLVTLVFGFLPILTASRVRPIVVLRMTKNQLQTQGSLWQNILVLIGLNLVLGLMVGYILEDYLLGIGGTFGAFILIYIFGWVMKQVVKVLAYVPSFGSASLNMAQRAMRVNLNRTANTLLGLVVGIFVLSLLLLLTRGLIDTYNTTTRQRLGGNILAITDSAESFVQLQTTASESSSINNIIFDEFYTGQLVAINNNRDMDMLMDEARLRASEFLEADDLEGDLQGFVSDLTIQPDSDKLVYTVESGNKLTADIDNGIVLRQSPVMQSFALAIGDSLTFKYEGDIERTVTIVGLLPAPPLTIPLFSIGDGQPADAVVSPSVIPSTLTPSPSVVIVDSLPDSADATMNQLMQIDGVTVVDVNLLPSFVSAVLEQLIVLPIIVAALALISSSITIANTVSLTTMERERDTGIMKAMGIKGFQILGMLLLENGVVGLIGGLVGVLIAVLCTAIPLLILGQPFQGIPWIFILSPIALSVVLAIAATLVTAISVTWKKPLLLLRAE